jgi:TolB-like protein
LRLEAARAAAALCERAEAAGDLEEALRRAHAALSLDAGSERAFRRLAELLHSGGDRAGVAQAYEAWRHRLEEEYGIEPSTETQQTIAALLGAEVGVEEGLQRRPASPSHARLDLLAGSSATTIAASPVPREARRLRRGLAWAGALTTLAVLLAGAMVIRGMPTLDPKRVLVTVFENQTGDPALDPVGHMAADWIARGLMEPGSIEVVSIASALYSPQEAAEQGIRELARQIGAGTVVSGTYYRENGVLYLQAQVTDAVRGRLLHTLDPISVPVDSATAGVELLRQRLAGTLAARFDGPTEWTAITRGSRPPTYAAYAEYIAGMELFSRRLQEQAVERFERAWANDTTFQLPRLYASLIHSNLRNPARADSVLRSVALHRERLTPFEQALLENLQAVLAGDHETALRLARRMNEMAPASMLVGQAAGAVATNRPAEAVAAFRQPKNERRVMNEWFGYWWHLATAHHMLGDHGKELKVARDGRQQFPEQLLLMESRALAALGRVAELERLLHENPPSASARYTPADALRNGAIELRAHGHGEAAERFFEEALAWYRARPEAERTRLRPMYARTLYEAQRWEEAHVLFKQLAVEQPGNVDNLGSLGTIAARRGDRAEAKRISTLLAASTQPYLRGAHTLWRARIAAQLGDSEEALHLLRQAFSEGQGYDLWLHTDVDLDLLRELRAFRALVRPKG